jgi:carboxyl-terminal processing protease
MRRAGAIAAVALLLAGSFTIGLLVTRSQSVSARAPMSAPSVEAGPSVEPAPARGESVSPALVEVREQLERSYYRAVSPDVLDEKTIDGVLEKLGDSNTDYLTRAEYQSLRNRTARSYPGVGLTVEPTRAGLLVTSALRGPARQAGIKRGDLIVRIDGKPAGKLTFEQSIALIKGEKGTVVHLSVRRGGEERKDYAIVRQEVTVPTLKTRLLTVRKRPIGYVRLLAFPASSSDRLAEATASLLDRGAKSLILDLRDNPGGLLAQAVRTVSLFVADGVVCTTDGVHQEEQAYEVSGRATFPKLPVVVLVNGGSASAAEIVAAALQDHERAVVVGQRTFGKASVQSIRPLRAGGALKLTTAMYRTPSGADLTEVGIRPDVKAADDPLTKRDEAVRAAQRALLKQVAG